MNLVQRALTRALEAVAGPIIEARVEERLARRGESWSEEPPGFRRITAGARDISPTSHARMLVAADKIYRENPLGRRLVEITLDNVVGDGIQFECGHEGLQEALDEHWADPDNDWEENLERYFADILVDGELFLRPFTNPVDGSVRWSPIYTRTITEVVADPENPDRLKMIDVAGVGPLYVIRRNQDAKSPKFGFLEGEVLAFSINRRTNALRGTSDLMHLLDWLDAFDQLFWSELERMYLMKLFVFDYELKGAGPQEVRRRYNQVKKDPPRPGSYNVHNESEVFSIKTAETGGQDSTTFTRFCRDHILGGAGYPSHWFGDLHGATRASALETSEPATRRLKRPQRWLRRFVRAVLSYQRDQWILARPERRKEFLDPKRPGRLLLPHVKIHTPDQGQKVQLAAAKVFASVVQPLIQAVEKNLVTTEEARDIIRRALLQQLGLEGVGQGPAPAGDPTTDPEPDDEDEDPGLPPVVTGSIGGNAS